MNQLATLSQDTMIALPAGYSSRPPTLADAQAVTDLANLSAQKYTGRDEFDANVLLSFWKIPDFDLNQSARVVIDPDGRLIAYYDVDDTGSMPVNLDIWGRIHPDYENLGISTAMHNWVEQRVQQVLPRLPEDVRVTMQTVIWSNSEPMKRLVTDRDFSHVRDYWHMLIEFKEPQPMPIWPDGIRLSNLAEQQNLRAVVAAVEEAFADHWGHVDRPLDEAVKNFKHWVDNDDKHDPRWWILALDGDKIAGLSLCQPEERTDPDKGWVSVLGVRRPYRGLGLGLALLQQSFWMFQQSGRKRAGLSVDAASLTGATRLYKKAGMVVEQQRMVFEKEIQAGRDVTTQTVESH